MFRFFGRPTDVARTFVHFLMYAVLGLMMSIPGPTLIDLTELCGTDSHSISFLYTARSVGYLIGSLSGGIVLDCMKKEDFAIVTSSAFVAIGAFAIPWCRSLPTLLVTFIITGFAMGFSNTGCNASCLRIWGKKGAPVLQALHFTYGIGGFLAPVIAAPFLSTQELIAPVDFTLLGVTQNLTTELQSQITTIFSNNTDAPQLVTISELPIPSVAYAYIIIGVWATVACGSFVFVFSLTSTEKNATDETAKEITRDPGLVFTIVVVILACLLTGLTSGIEVSFAQMLTSYAVQSGHGLSKFKASLLTSSYWATYSATRLLSIFLTLKVSIRKLLATDLILATSAALVLLIFGTWSETALWIGTAMLGVGVASIFPGTMSWVEKYININNRIASVFTLISCILEMTIPLTISMYLGSKPNVLFQFITAATLSCCILFVVLNAILRRKGKKYEKPSKENEKLSAKIQSTQV